MEHDDLDIDDISQNLNKKKKIKSGIKGKTGEAQIVKILNERFADILAANPTWGGFSRSIGSGNRISQNVQLSQNAMEIFAGDLTTPAPFRFVIESKNGYNNIDLCDCFNNKCSELDAFLAQASGDAKKVNKLPMLIWKKNRKERIAFIDSIHLPDSLKNSQITKITYLNWIGLNLETLLTLPDNWFFGVLQLRCSD